jgi:hypothetical protein
VSFIGFGVMVVEWLVFAAVLVLSPATLDTVTVWFRRLPILAKVVVVLVLLPLALALWIWRRPWPVTERRVIIAIMAVLWCVGIFPRPH